MPAYTGTVQKVTTDPNAVRIRTSEGPPPVEVTFTPLTDAQLILVSAAFGASVTVTAPGPGTTPTSVSRP